MPEGIRTLISRYSVDDSVAILKALLLEKNVKLFCLIDHSGEAAAAKLEMPPTKVVIFGNPKAGTPLMVAAPSTALDLPLRILVAQGADGRVSLSWNDPSWLQQRHGFPQEMLQNLGLAELLAKSLADEAGNLTEAK